MRPAERSAEEMIEAFPASARMAWTWLFEQGDTNAFVKPELVHAAVGWEGETRIAFTDPLEQLDTAGLLHKADGVSRSTGVRLSAFGISSYSCAFELGDRAWYVGPQSGDQHFEDWLGGRSVGSSGKVRGIEDGAVYVDWGGKDEGWEPRSYVVTGDKWRLRAIARTA